MTESTEVVSVSLVFENCESISFEPSAIGNFSMDGLHTGIGRVAVNSVSKHDFVDDVFLELYLDKGLSLHLFDKNTVDVLRERLMHNDITSVNLTYRDGHDESYCVEYDEGDFSGELGAPNILQDTYLDGDKAYICISKSKRVSDFIDLDAIESERIKAKYPDMVFGVGVCKPDDKETEPESGMADSELGRKMSNMAIIAVLKEQMEGTRKMLNLVQDLVS